MAGGHSLIYEFVSEAKEHLANVTDDLLALEQKQDENVRYRVDRVFRAVHSVKGGAGFFGCRRIEELGHALETVLDPLRDDPAPLTPPLIDALLAAADRIQVLLDDVEHSNDADVGDVLNRLHALKPAPAAPPTFALTEAPLAPRPSGEGYLYGLTIDLVECHARQGLAPAAVLGQLRKAGTLVNGRLIAPEGDLQSPLSPRGLLYQALLSSALPPEQARAALGLSAVEMSVLESPAAPSATVEAPAAAAPEKPATTLRIPVQLVDRLMTLAGELVLVRNQAMRAPAALADAFRPVLQRLDAVTSDMQDAVMRTRMQPVGNLFGRFPRLVRDLARQLGKEIELDVAGTEVELDKSILENLSDPLTHLVRNACDHGIEPPARRQGLGKPPAGRLILNARHHGGQIFIEVRDDGKGIDLEAVRRKAVQVGLRTPAELARMGDKEVLSLILQPGFSTASALTDVSGRGVGMDVVKTNLDRMGGALEIDSVVGRGTTFTLRLPLTLAIIPCLLVTSGGQRYAVPQKDLEELAFLPAARARERVEHAHDQEVLRWRNRLLPLVRLDEVLARPRPFNPTARAQIRKSVAARAPGDSYLAVVKVGSQRFGLLLDAILTTEEVVVKPMHSALKRLRCYAGATILGDGRVSLILSIEGVARHAGVQYELEADRPRLTETRSGEAQTTLLFRHGPGEQFALPLAMVRRIALIDPARIEPIGGQEFLTLDGVSTEVLRLDRFLDVTAGVAKAPAFLILPRNMRRPLGILASEIIDTRESGLELDTEAYRPDGLLGSAVVRGKMTLFLDVYRLADLLEGARPRPAAPPVPDRPRKILLVEDTPFFQQLVKGYLETVGFAVTIAGNGAEGLAALEDATFDLVISDIEMPVMDGWAFARAVRQRPQGGRQRLMALTTLSDEQDRARALECGFDRHEVKIDRDRFLVAVSEMLAS